MEYTQECKPSYNYGQECKSVPHQKCQYVTVPKCHSVPHEKCKWISVPNCVKVPEQHCSTKYEEICNTVPTEVEVVNQRTTCVWPEAREHFDDHSC
jgi:hypothetical protein